MLALLLVFAVLYSSKPYIGGMKIYLREFGAFEDGRDRFEEGVLGLETFESIHIVC